MTKDRRGFTLVELLLSMAFFSFILLFITTGFIIISRAYNKGLTVKLVQDEGRGLIEQLTREIRVAGSASIITDNVNKCLELNGYRYYWSVPISTDAGSPGRLYREEGKKCLSSPITTSGGESVLDDRVGVQFIEVNRVANSSSTYAITIVLSTSEVDILEGSGEDAACTTDLGGQYCDIVKFSTVVNAR